MSYSIAVRGKSIAGALAALAVKFDKLVAEPQPVHVHDRATALASAEAQTKLLRPMVATDHIVLQLHGSLGWDYQKPGGAEFNSANTGATAYYVADDSPNNGLEISE